MPPKSKHEPCTIKRSLIKRELPPRAFRHGKPIVMLTDYNPAEYEPGEVGIRKSNTITVPSGPTIKRGLINGAGEGGAFATAPQWWKEQS